MADFNLDFVGPAARLALAAARRAELANGDVGAALEAVQAIVDTVPAAVEAAAEPVIAEAQGWADDSASSAGAALAERQNMTALLADQASAFTPPIAGLPRLNLDASGAVAGRFSNGAARVMTSGAVDQLGETIGAQLGLPQTTLRKTSKRLALGPQTGSPISEANDAAGYTYHQMIVLETPFDQVELLFENHLTAGAQTIGPVKVATLTSLAGGFNNVGAWTDVTFGGNATVTVANATDGANPQYAISDAIALASAQRADFPARSILLVRVFVPSATSPQSLQGEVASLTTPVWPSDNTGRSWAVWRAPGNGVSDPTTFPASPTAVNRWPCVAALARSTQAGGRAAIVVNPGDSIQMGPTGGSTAHTWQGVKAATLPTLPLGWINMAWIGQTTSQYLARAQRLFPIILPDIAFYVAWSPNDSGAPVQANADTAIANLEAFLTLCRRYQVLPIVGTAIPSDSYTADQDRIRQQVNTYVRELGARFMIADYDAVISDGAFPARIRPEYKLNLADPLHPNDSGQRAMSAVDAAVLKRIEAAQFQRFAPPAAPNAFEAIYGGLAGFNLGQASTAAPYFVPLFGGDATENTGVQL